MRRILRSGLARTALLPVALGALLVGGAVVGPGTETASAHYSCRYTYLDVGARDLPRGPYCVKHMQRALNEYAPWMGMRPTTIDGVYGPYTARMVRRFKVKVGLADRTLVGPTTWNFLTCSGRNFLGAAEVTTATGARDSIQLVGC